MREQDDQGAGVSCGDRLIPGQAGGRMRTLGASTPFASRSPGGFQLWRRGAPSGGSPLLGLLAVTVATAVASAASHFAPGLDASTAGVVLGAVMVNVGWHRPCLHAGTRVASHLLSWIAVVLLGCSSRFPSWSLWARSGRVSSR